MSEDAPEKLEMNGIYKQVGMGFAVVVMCGISAVGGGTMSGHSVATDLALHEQRLVALEANAIANANRYDTFHTNQIKICQALETVLELKVGCK